MYEKRVGADKTEMPHSNAQLVMLWDGCLCTLVFALHHYAPLHVALVQL